MKRRNPRLSFFLVACVLAVIPAHADIRVPDDYPTIESALAAIEGGVEADLTVTVAPGTYSEDIVLSNGLPSGVVLRGEETARTELTGTVSVEATSVRIGNFTFAGGDPSVNVTLGSATIAANVFAPPEEATAISVLAGARAEILNNVFYRGGTSIDTGEESVLIENNAFVSVLVPVSGVLSAGSISNNAFFESDPVGEAPVEGDPLFVNAEAGDFHLRAGSPLIDSGAGTDVFDDTAADIGAYGGEFAEGIPLPVGNLEVTDVEEDGLETRIALAWDANEWYRIGGYRLHYGATSGPPYGGTGADEGESPVDAGDATSFVLNGLPVDTGDALEAPVLAPPEPRDGALRLAWTAVPGAAGYSVTWRVADGDEEHEVDVGDTNSFLLTGLENGTDYAVRVNAYAQAGYFFAVTAHPDFDTGLSSAFSGEAAVSVGPRITGLPSEERVDFPEAVVAFPWLEDKGGCFIATAAYGYYGAREVRLLRRFRDEVLMKSAPGRAFVAWYYARSPAWARAVRESTPLRGATRVALAPAIGIAAFALHVPGAAQAGIACLMLVILYLYAARVRSNRRAKCAR